MISVIICSRNATALSLVAENIHETIGVPYEVIAIDNSKNIYGICEAYNLGASQAQYDLLCFMHEDISFYTERWGKLVNDILSDKDIGAIGVAGTKYLLKAPTPWWFLGDKFNRMQLVHAIPGEEEEVALSNPLHESLSEVVVLDGLWICTRKQVWNKFKFDESTFSGFHYYDIDFCAQLYKRFKVYVTFDIKVNHLSKGTLNAEWIKYALKFQEKYKNVLPIGVEAVDSQTNRFFEQDGYYDFLKVLVKENAPKLQVLYYLTKLGAFGINNKQILSVIKRLLKKAF